MRIGYISLPGKGATDPCLAQVVARLATRGVPMAGTLPDGPVIRISQEPGDGARGCRLEGGALEEAVAEVAQRLDGAALLIVSKFGEPEAAGRGLVPVIAEAVDRGLPVLLGVNGLNLPTLLAFVEGAAHALPADPGAIAGWALDAVTEPA